MHCNLGSLFSQFPKSWTFQRSEKGNDVIAQCLFNLQHCVTLLTRDDNRIQDNNARGIRNHNSESIHEIGYKYYCIYKKSRSRK